MQSGLARQIDEVLRYMATTSARVMPGRSLKVMTSEIMANPFHLGLLDTSILSPKAIHDNS